MRTVTAVVALTNQITQMIAVEAAVVEEVGAVITVMMMMQAAHLLLIEIIAAVDVAVEIEIGLVHPPLIATEISMREGVIVQGHVQGRALLIAKRGIATPHAVLLPVGLIPAME